MELRNVYFKFSVRKQDLGTLSQSVKQEGYTISHLLEKRTELEKLHLNVLRNMLE